MEFRFDDFIKSGIYLRSWSQKPVRTYKQGLSAFQLSFGERHPLGAPSSDTPLAKSDFDAFVIWMRQRGLAPGGCNMYIRTVNSYLSWLHEEGVLPASLRIKLLPDPKKPLRTFTNPASE
jgi:site-specific recombinase XerC